MMIGELDMRIELRDLTVRLSLGRRQAGKLEENKIAAGDSVAGGSVAPGGGERRTRTSGAKMGSVAQMSLLQYICMSTVW